MLVALTDCISVTGCRRWCRKLKVSTEVTTGPNHKRDNSRNNGPRRGFAIFEAKNTASETAHYVLPLITRAS